MKIAKEHSQPQTPQCLIRNKLNNTKYKYKQK